MLINLGRLLMLCVWAFLLLNLFQPFPKPLNIFVNVALIFMILMHGLQLTLLKATQPKDAPPQSRGGIPGSGSHAAEPYGSHRVVGARKNCGSSPGGTGERAFRSRLAEKTEGDAEKIVLKRAQGSGVNATNAVPL